MGHNSGTAGEKQDRPIYPGGMYFFPDFFWGSSKTVLSLLSTCMTGKTHHPVVALVTPVLTPTHQNIRIKVKVGDGESGRGDSGSVVVFSAPV